MVGGVAVVVLSVGVYRGYQLATAGYHFRAANTAASPMVAADAPITQEMLGQHLKTKMAIRDHPYMTSCSTCHR